MANGFGIILGCAALALSLAGCATGGSGGTAVHVIDHLANAEAYYPRNPLFRKAFDFVRGNDLAKLPAGRYEIAGEDCYAMIQEPTLKTASASARFEAHGKYIDIQIPIDGEELYGLATTPSGVLAGDPWAKGDAVLFDAPLGDGRVRSPVTVRPGDFAIFFPPQGAHAPGLTTGAPRRIRKLVIKVRAME